MLKNAGCTKMLEMLDFSRFFLYLSKYSRTSINDITSAADAAHQIPYCSYILKMYSH